MNLDCEILEQNLDGIENAIDCIKGSPGDVALVLRQASMIEALIRRCFIRLDAIRKAKLNEAYVAVM